jgi:hypothetical protein
VRCEGWPDYEKNKTTSNKRFISGEILAEEDMNRISIYGRILNPLDERDRYITPFLLLKKMCVYYSDYLNNKVIEKENQKINKNNVELKKSEKLELEQTANEVVPPLEKQEEEIHEDAIKVGKDNTSDSVLTSGIEVRKYSKAPLETVQEDLSSTNTTNFQETPIKKIKNVKIVNRKGLIKEFFIGLTILGMFRLLYLLGFFDSLFQAIKRKFQK